MHNASDSSNTAGVSPLSPHGERVGVRGDAETTTLISLAAVSKTFEHPHTVALRDVSLSVAKGEFVCIIGPSGEGKSTILKLMAGLEEPTTGTVSRPTKVAMAFQSAALFPWLSVFENIALGLRAEKKAEAEIRDAVRAQITMMKLGGLEAKLPRELSGGQAQRVGIARALAVDPEVLLLDEPFSALDPKTTAELHDDILDIWHTTRTTIAMVSHIIEEAVSLADRVILVKKGVVAKAFPIHLPHPRREQAAIYMHEVQEIRKEFFRE